MRFTMTLLLTFLALGCSKQEAEAPVAAHTVPPAAAPVVANSAVPALPNAAGDMAAAHGAMPAGHGAPAAHGGAAAGPAAVDIGAFAPADRTIADVLAHRQELNGKTVEIRGRVMKANHGILDRNWLHLRDSSGEVALVVTTTQPAQRGDLVRAKGVVVLDRDVGAGYKYETLLENSTVVVEGAGAATPTTAP